MICELENTADILPMFRTYLEYMSRFYSIAHPDAWCDTAVRNMQQFTRTQDQQIYVLRQSGVIVGFAQVNAHLRLNTSGRAIAEFYVQKESEGNGYGRTLAEYAFDQFKGLWEVVVAPKNINALMFWRRVICDYTSGDFKEKNTNGFLFENR